jgi:hypothetical protein
MIRGYFSKIFLKFFKNQIFGKNILKVLKKLPWNPRASGFGLFFLWGNKYS